MNCFAHPIFPFLLLLLAHLEIIAGNPGPALKPSQHYRHPDSQWGPADGFVHFAKTIYNDLGERQGNITAVADEYQGQFDQLNKSTKGQLGDSLSALFAIRVLDLQSSILHTRKMQELLSSFMKK